MPHAGPEKSPGHPPGAHSPLGRLPGLFFLPTPHSLEGRALRHRGKGRPGTFQGQSSEAWVETDQKLIVTKVVSIPADFATGRNPKASEPPLIPLRPASDRATFSGARGGGVLPAGRTGTGGRTLSAPSDCLAPTQRGRRPRLGRPSWALSGRSPAPPAWERAPGAHAEGGRLPAQPSPLCPRRRPRTSGKENPGSRARGEAGPRPGGAHSPSAVRTPTCRAGSPRSSPRGRGSPAHPPPGGAGNDEERPRLHVCAAPASPAPSLISGCGLR